MIELTARVRKDDKLGRIWGRSFGATMLYDLMMDDGEYWSGLRERDFEWLATEAQLPVIPWRQ